MCLREYCTCHNIYTQHIPICIYRIECHIICTGPGQTKKKKKVRWIKMNKRRTRTNNNNNNTLPSVSVPAQSLSRFIFFNLTSLRSLNQVTPGIWGPDWICDIAEGRLGFIHTRGKWCGRLCDFPWPHIVTVVVVVV